MRPLVLIGRRSSWIPGSYAPALTEKHSSFVRLVKNKGFKEESRTKVRLEAIGTSTPLASNKSQLPDCTTLVAGRGEAWEACP